MPTEGKPVRRNQKT